MQFISIPLRKQKLPYKHLRFGVLAFYLGHIITSCFAVVHVSHVSKVRNKWNADTSVKSAQVADERIKKYK